MLWTDDDFLTVDDLQSLDAEVQAVANADLSTPMTLTGPNGVIRRAVEEAGDHLMKNTQQFGINTYGHNAAIANIGQQSASNFSKLLVSQVVITSPLAGWSPLKRWAAYWALALFYRDAANRTNGDRYNDKRLMYQKDINTKYWDAVRTLGIPIVSCPLPCPGALYEPNTGVWGNSNITLVNGSGTLAVPVTIKVTWYDATKTQNNESGPSVAANVTMISGKLLRVSIATLTPPNGTQPLATQSMASIGYGNATGWKVWVSVDSGPMICQTPSPIDIGTTSYTFTANPVTSVVTVGTGQYAERYIAISNILHRG